MLTVKIGSHKHRTCPKQSERLNPRANWSVQSTPARHLEKLLVPCDILQPASAANLVPWEMTSCRGRSVVGNIRCDQLISRHLLEREVRHQVTKQCVDICPSMNISTYIPGNDSLMAQENSISVYRCHAFSSMPNQKGAKERASIWIFILETPAPFCTKTSDSFSVPALYGGQQRKRNMQQQQEQQSGEILGMGVPKRCRL